MKVGDTFSITRTFSQQDTIQFAAITRDYNPVHFDERYTRVKNFDRCICHGLLIAGMITEIGGQIGWLASGMNFYFKKPVYFGDTVTCDFTITNINGQRQAEAKAVMKNQDDLIVLEADLFGIIPGSSEQNILNTMVAEGDPTNKIRN